jgi:hypothetical protein
MAVAHLEKLAAWAGEEEEIEGPLRSALSIMEVAGWVPAAVSTLWGRLSLPGANPRPEVAELWATLTCRALGRFWEVEAILEQLWRVGPTIAGAAASAYLEALADSGQQAKAQQFIGAHAAHLRVDERAWGSVAYVWFHADNAFEAVRWTDDWRANPAARPWGLLFRALALREQDRAAEANAVSRHALTLVRSEDGDSSPERHRILLAFDAALAGDPAGAEAFLREAGEPETGLPYFRFIRGLAETIVRLHRGIAAPGVDRGALFAAAKDDLGRVRATFPDAKQAALLVALYRKTVRHITEKIGGPAVSVWAATAGRL